MSVPLQPSISDLVPLMYRARWAWFGLSGAVRSRESRAGEGSWEERGSFEVAPGGRYRAEVIDQDGDRDVLVGDGDDGPVPFPELLVPSLLLPDFDLRVTGRAEYLGRDGIAIAGSPRLAGLSQRERVTGLVDAELGILLRYRRVSRGRTDSSEFTALTVGRPEPAAWDQNPGRRPGGHQSPSRGAPALTDSAVNLLYRSGLGPQRFTADLSEQADIATMMRLARESFAATEFGNRIRWAWRPSDDHLRENVDRVARLSVAMPGCYLIEAVTDPGSGPARIACDGQRLWRVYPDRVALRAAEPAPRRIAVIIDPAWLLRESEQVSVLGEAMVDGRPALHVTAPGGALSAQSGPLSGTPILADQVEAFIDHELGVCLRLICSYQRHPVLRTEFTGLTTEVDQAQFSFEPPPGMPVITGGLFAEADLSPASVALQAASVALQAAKGAAALAFEIGRRWLSRNEPTEPGS